MNTKFNRSKTFESLRTFCATHGKELVSLLLITGCILFTTSCILPQVKKPDRDEHKHKIAGLVVDDYGFGKTLFEEEVTRLNQVVQNRKLIGRKPFIEFGRPEKIYVFVRIMKEEPDVFGRQYEFSSDLRHMQIRIRSGFCHADPDTLYYELDESACRELEQIFRYFKTKERKQAFFFDGKALEFIPDWRSRIEPWVETDETIGEPFLDDSSAE